MDGTNGRFAFRMNTGASVIQSSRQYHHLFFFSFFCTPPPLSLCSFFLVSGGKPHGAQHEAQSTHGPVSSTSWSSCRRGWAKNTWHLPEGCRWRITIQDGMKNTTLKMTVSWPAIKLDLGQPVRSGVQFENLPPKSFPTLHLTAQMPLHQRAES